MDEQVIASSNWVMGMLFSGVTCSYICTLSTKASWGTTLAFLETVPQSHTLKYGLMPEGNYLDLL